MRRIIEVSPCSLALRCYWLVVEGIAPRAQRPPLRIRTRLVSFAGLPMPFVSKIRQSALASSWLDTKDSAGAVASMRRAVALWPTNQSMLQSMSMWPAGASEICRTGRGTRSLHPYPYAKTSNVELQQVTAFMPFAIASFPCAGVFC